MGARYGGEGIADIFQIKSDHTVLVKADGSTAATAPTDALIRIGGAIEDAILEQTDWSYDDNGVPSLSFAQTDSGEEFVDFLKKVAPKKAGASAGNVEEKSDEKGRKIGGASSSSGAVECVNVHYGAKGADGKIPVTLNVGYFKKSSGKRTTKNGSWVAPGLDLVGVALKAALTIPATIFDTTVVTAPTAAVTVAKDFYEEIIFLEPAA